MTPATFEQKLYGEWSDYYYYYLVFDFFPDGKTIHVSGYGEQIWGSYCVKRDRLYMDNVESSLTIKDINNIILDKRPTKRKKNPLPPNVSFLFDAENQVVTERE